jgi:hypothetical protein
MNEEIIAKWQKESVLFTGERKTLPVERFVKKTISSAEIAFTKSVL